MRATAVVKTCRRYPISGFGGRVGVVGCIPNSISLIRGSNAELQQPYRPWTWSSNRYVILQPFFGAAPWGPALEGREREKQPSDLQINFHWTLNISCKQPCSRRADGLHVWPTDLSECTQSCADCGKIKRWVWKLTTKLQTRECSGCLDVYTELKVGSHAAENAFISQTKAVTVCNEWQEDFREKMLHRRALTWPRAGWKESCLDRVSRPSEHVVDERLR